MSNYYFCLPDNPIPDFVCNSIDFLDQEFFKAKEVMLSIYNVALKELGVFVRNSIAFLDKKFPEAAPAMLSIYNALGLQEQSWTDRITNATYLVYAAIGLARISRVALKELGGINNNTATNILACIVSAIALTNQDNRRIPVLGISRIAALGIGACFLPDLLYQLIVRNQLYRQPPFSYLLFATR